MKNNPANNILENIPPDSQSKNIAVLQLTRIGDLIQTAQAVILARKTHPDHQYTLICRKRFSQGIMFLLSEVFDHVVQLDFKNHLLDFQLDHNYELLVKKLIADIDDISTNPIDTLVNLTFSRSSQLLAYKINAKNKVGPVLEMVNQQGQLNLENNWCKYVYSSVLSGPLNPFSVVDLFKFILEAQPKVTTSPFSLGTMKKDKNKVVILHPFASSSKKFFKASKWSEIIFQVLKENPSYSFKIVGSKEDKERSLAITNAPTLDRFKHQIQSFVGKKSIKETYELILESELFIGHDSMVAHLASFSDIKMIVLPLGVVRYSETTPYRDNIYVIHPRTKCYPCFPNEACSYFQCHADVQYKVISTAASSLINNGEITTKSLNSELTPFHLGSARIKKTKFNNSCLDFDQLDEEVFDLNEVFHTLYKISWGYFIDEIDFNLPFPELTQKTHAQLLSYVEGIQQLYELSEFGKKFSLYILEELAKDPPSINEIKNYSKKIEEIDKLQDMLKVSYPRLSPIIDFFKIDRANLEGNNIVTLTESSYLSYESEQQISSILYDLIEKSISEYKHLQNDNKPNLENRP
jgi:ADP-heptose:LPS heptosyltransferase